jgi:3-hydroxyisobutyrate dehydrogenase-like beta-hydroxyacid dehydrogenase
MSREVIFGKDGLAAGAKKGLVIADCSTISPKESRQMAEKLLESGIDFLDAPCTGSKAGAENGTLTFMVGGKERSLIACVPGLNQWANNSIIAVIQVRASMPSSLRT